jgi:glycosyltransferase involved in cell wall biosynthesis
VKVAYLCPEAIHLRSPSGAAVHVTHNVEALRARGLHVELIAPPESFRQPGVNGSRADRPASARGGDLYRTIVPEAVRRPVHRVRARRAHRRFVEASLPSMGRADIVYERDAFDAFAGTSAVEKVDLPRVLECNGIYWGPVGRHTLGWDPGDRYRARHVEKWRRADRIITVSGHFRDHIVAEGVDPRRVVVIHNAADLPAHDAIAADVRDTIRSELGLSDRLVIGFLGHVRPWHRIGLLMEAVARLQGGHPELAVLSVGGGADRVAEAARRAGVSAPVHATGSVPYERAIALLRAMDVCTLPGIHEPGSPVKLFDYGAAEKAVVAVGSHSVRELIRDGRNGILFEEGSAASLASAIGRLAGDADLTRSLGARLRAQVERDHSWARVAQRTEEVLRDAMEERFRGSR